VAFGGTERGRCQQPYQLGERLFDCVYANEFDKHASAVYRHIWRTNSEFKEGDIREQNTDEIPDIDFLTAGFPCQSFSVAGKRLGMEDTRGTLFFEVARVLADKRPRHFLLENVKGLLSHDGGKTFQIILTVLTDLGYRVEWEVLNSTCWVPQNRERVFIIGHLRGECGCQVFPLREDDGVYPEPPEQDSVANCLDSNYWKGWLDKGQRTMVVHKTSGQTVTVRNNETGCLQAGGMNVRDKVPNVVLYHTAFPGDIRTYINEAPTPSTPAGGGHLPYVGNGVRFRRLTPKECERLQGWPDSHTALGLYHTADLLKFKRGQGEYTLQPVSDTQRYRMTGNGVTADVVREIVLKMIAVGCFVG